MARRAQNDPTPINREESEVEKLAKSDAVLAYAELRRIAFSKTAGLTVRQAALAKILKLARVEKSLNAPSPKTAQKSTEELLKEVKE